MSSPQQLLQTYSEQLSLCLQKDQALLKRRLHSARQRLKQGKPCDRILAEIGQQLAASSQARDLKAAQAPSIEFPEALPIADKREQIARAIADHQVVVVAGETGSGKTTQLPKICLQLGRGINGLIGHTQPRRLAAKTVAQRIADELQTPLGQGVGYQVRFNDQTSEQSYIKLMTDGILLAEIQNDRLLSAYDTIIIDEAHERSLNIDFLLGYLKQLLPQRPDLKVIITSATIDLERFAKHFDDAPVIEVSGRTFPVETRYWPLNDISEDNDLAQGIEIAARQLIDEDGSKQGDILVFLSGEAEIREVSRKLRDSKLPHVDVLPLYSRLSNSEQAKIFDLKQRRGRRIILATKVADLKYPNMVLRKKRNKNNGLGDNKEENSSV